MTDEQQQINDLKKQLKKIESALEKLSTEKNVYFFNIEHVDVDGPFTDKLDFVFDKIDVKEVSGALNLGNNFGVKVADKKQKKKKTDQSDETSAKQSSSHGGQSTSSEEHSQQTLSDLVKSKTDLGHLLTLSEMFKEEPALLSSHKLKKQSHQRHISESSNNQDSEIKETLSRTHSNKQQERSQSEKRVDMASTLKTLNPEDESLNIQYKDQNDEQQLHSSQTLRATNKQNSFTRGTQDSDTKQMHNTGLIHEDARNLHKSQKQKLASFDRDDSFHSTTRKKIVGTKQPVKHTSTISSDDKQMVGQKKLQEKQFDQKENQVTKQQQLNLSDLHNSERKLKNKKSPIQKPTNKNNQEIHNSNKKQVETKRRHEAESNTKEISPKKEQSVKQPETETNVAKKKPSKLNKLLGKISPVSKLNKKDATSTYKQVEGEKKKELSNLSNKKSNPSSPKQQTTHSKESKYENDLSKSPKLNSDQHTKLSSVSKTKKGLSIKLK